jgi:hypothetical protein
MEGGMAMLSAIRWKRVLLAAFLSEVAVIVILLTATTIYSRLVMPGITDAQYQELGRRAGYYIAPAAGAVTTVLMVLWVGRALESGYIANGVMVGVVSVILTSGFFFTAKPEDRLMYGLAFLLRIVAGYLGGLAAQKLSAKRQGTGSTVPGGRRTLAAP